MKLKEEKIMSIQVISKHEIKWAKIITAKNKAYKTPSFSMEIEPEVT